MTKYFLSFSIIFTLMSCGGQGTSFWSKSNSASSVEAGSGKSSDDNGDGSVGSGEDKGDDGDKSGGSDDGKDDGSGGSDDGKDDGKGDGSGGSDDGKDDGSGGSDDGKDDGSGSDKDGGGHKDGGSKDKGKGGCKKGDKDKGHDEDDHGDKKCPHKYTKEDLKQDASLLARLACGEHKKTFAVCHRTGSKSHDVHLTFIAKEAVENRILKNSDHKKDDFLLKCDELGPDAVHRNHVSDDRCRCHDD